MGDTNIPHPESKTNPLWKCVQNLILRSWCSKSTAILSSRESRPIRTTTYSARESIITWTILNHSELTEVNYILRASSSRWTRRNVVLRAASQKLMISNWRNVLRAISFDTAVMHVRENINLSPQKRARTERLNYVTSYYSSNQTAHILGTARYAVYLFSRIARSLLCIVAAANWFVMAAPMPICYERRKGGLNTAARSVDNLLLRQWTKLINKRWKE